MARPKTREDVELARIKADLERSRLKFRTIVQSLALLALVAMVAIVAWSAVRMTEKPPWLVLALALFGTGSFPTLAACLFVIYLRRVDKRLEGQRLLKVPPRPQPPADGDKGE